MRRVSADPTGSYLLDTSAILAYCLNEPQASRVASLSKDADFKPLASDLKLLFLE